ncbi:hypothetical protein [Catenulispora pinisilvae]|uniref:hypothetical protein n=1 Tax=Catenulispora pinisilvae TaxID=2705253 RepID=UPI0018921A7C|nr:hypothetical protein [Catenulispora pinisilvae]
MNKSELDGQGLQSTCNPMYEVDYCAAGKLSDGTIVYVVHGTGEPANGPMTHNDSITIERPDHLQINVVEWSSGPLTDDQLYAIVSDPRWALKMDQSFIAQADQQIRPFGN